MYLIRIKVTEVMRESRSKPLGLGGKFWGRVVLWWGEGGD